MVVRATSGGGGGGTVQYGTYVPVITSSGGTLTSVTNVSGDYITIGHLVFVSIGFTIANNGTGTTSLQATLPFPVVTDAGRGFMFHGRNTGTGLSVQGLLEGNGGSLLSPIVRYDNQYPASSGNAFYITGWYQKAE